MTNKLKLALSEPIGTIAFAVSSFFRRRRLSFKKKFLYSKYNIDKTVGVHLETFVYGNGEISIGEYTYLGKNTFVASNPKEAKIKIGQNCKISHGCHFRTEDYDPKTVHLDKPEKTFSNITIGDNCWIGANVFVRGGITIGDNVTVGVNSVVTKSFPSNVIVGGAPAKVLKTF